MRTRVALPALSLLLCVALLSPYMAFAAEEAAAPAEQPPPPPEPDLQPLRQVQVQVWISETTEDGLRNIGTNLNYSRVVRGEEQSGSVERVVSRVFDPNAFEVVLPVPNNQGYPGNVRLTPDVPRTVATPQVIENSGISAPSGAGMTFSIIDSNRGTIDGIMRAIEQTADADLISKPELLVVEGQTAHIAAGEEVPYQALVYQKGRAQLQVQWRTVGVNMGITPTVLSNDMIQIALSQLEVSDRLPSSPIRGIDLPVFSTRSQTGMVVVPNAQTLVIGGLSTRNVFKSERRLPVVGKLPVLGVPFRGRRMEARNSHLLIFVSPTIVDLRNLKPEAISALNFWREERWKNLDRIEQEIEIMENEL